MKKEIFNYDLKCGLDSIHIITQEWVQIIIPTQHCTDMRGAISLAKKVLPDVTRIMTTRACGCHDTEYRKKRKKKGWKSIDHRDCPHIY